MIDPGGWMTTLAQMRFAVCAVLAWLSVGWSARAEGTKLTVGEIVLTDAVEEKVVSTAPEKAITGRFACDVDVEGSQPKAVVIVAPEKVTVEAGGKPVSYVLKPGDFVGSLVWTSNDTAAMVVWNTRGVGVWLRYLISVTVDEAGGVKHRLVKAQHIADKLTVQRFIRREKDGVRARVRVLGEDRKVRYYEALLDVKVLPDFSEKASAQYGPRVE